MPELPEVETIVRGLRACLPGRRIRQVGLSRAARARILRTPAREFVRALEGASVADVRRYGKHILLRMARAGGRKADTQPGSLSSHFWWIVHLGMTGQLICEPSGREAPLHTHVWFELDVAPASQPPPRRAQNRDVPGTPEPARTGGNACPTVLRYTDIRQFGRMEIAALREEAPGDGSLPPRLERLGPDPLAISEAEFARRLRARKASVKALLLDQRFLRGLGNIYADECLFRAGLHPAASARRISPRRAASLWRAMRAVLQEAIAHGGSSVSDYRDARGRPGAFQQRHLVYGRADQPCLRCGARLRRAVVAGRGTTFCPCCQRR